MALKQQQPAAKDVRAWMNSTGRGYRAAASHFKVPEADLRALCGSGGRAKAAPTPDDGAKWLRVSDVAQHFGISPTAVRNWCTEDKVIHRKAGHTYEILLSSAEDLRAKKREPSIAPDSPGLIVDPSLEDVAWAEAHLRRLEEFAAPWIIPGGRMPPGGDKVLTEIRHTRAALQTARAAVPESLETLSVEEQVSRFRARVPEMPEQVLVTAVAEVARRYRARVELVRDDGRVVLGEDETWREVVQ